jgi:hypothetical protein
MKTSSSPFWVGITVIMVTYSFYSCNEMSVVEIQDTNAATQTQNETEGGHICRAICHALQIHYAKPRWL